jgi:hypothetical protein
MAQTAKRILIVDDDTSIFPLLQSVLSDESRILLTAPTLTKAREILQTEPVDLLLLDLYLFFIGPEKKRGNREATTGHHHDCVWRLGIPRKGIQARGFLLSGQTL